MDTGTAQSDGSGSGAPTVLVTGGLGFIGSAFVRKLMADTDYRVVNLDKVTYASTMASVEEVSLSDRYSLHRLDLADRQAVDKLVQLVKPDAIVHLAAETHVDRSIDGPLGFVQANVIGTANLLEAARKLGDRTRFVHVSTDEVFGSLGNDDPRFDEHTRYDPRSPYSATKAASDHLVRAWGETYGLHHSVTNCSNNYGPFQFPEKLIPLMIIKAARGEQLPVYGLGLNIRDWLHVTDHAEALLAVLENGESGRSYAIGGDSELTNIDVVTMICDQVDAMAGPLASGAGRRSLIEFVADRPGHDLRYGVDSTRIHNELGWKPTHNFSSGLASTVRWYLDNEQWWGPLMDGDDAGKRRGLQEVS